jgi:hypothetical protein
MASARKASMLTRRSGPAMRPEGEASVGGVGGPIGRSEWSEE